MHGGKLQEEIVHLTLPSFWHEFPISEPSVHPRIVILSKLVHMAPAWCIIAHMDT